MLFDIISQNLQERALSMLKKHYITERKLQPGWPWTWDIPASASQVSRIRSLYHQIYLEIAFLKRQN